MTSRLWKPHKSRGTVGFSGGRLLAPLGDNNTTTLPPWVALRESSHPPRPSYHDRNNDNNSGRGVVRKRRSTHLTVTTYPLFYRAERGKLKLSHVAPRADNADEAEILCLESGNCNLNFSELNPFELFLTTSGSAHLCCSSNAAVSNVGYMPERLGGIVSVCDQPRPLMVQAVYDMFDLEPVSADLGDSPSCRFIFIGRNLIAGKLKNLFEECIIQDDKLA
uniref:CobW C-terminal domain-containing protein n=1 Tax=Timema shepardi TaxID=629360 RepID=A0A7R9AWR5_TIMSH|nr:unnamed protein product [Timema shepardi]